MQVRETLYIGGKWVPSSSGKTFEDRSPADREDLIGVFARSGKDDVTPSFTLQIGAAPPAAPTATAQAVTPMALTYGIVAIIGVIGILAGAALLSRRLSQKGSRPSRTFPTPSAPTPVADRSAD